MRLVVGRNRHSRPVSFQPLQTHTPEAQATEAAHPDVPGAIGEQHSIISEMYCRVAIASLGILLNELASRPALATVTGDGCDKGCSFALRKGKPARMVIENGQEIRRTRQPLDAGGRFRGLK